MFLSHKATITRQSTIDATTQQQNSDIRQQTSRINIKKYLSVIGIKNDVILEPTYETLKLVVNKQIKSIPFQSFDLYAGKAQDLSPCGLQQRLLNQKNGGVCNEINELLYNALCIFGFDVKRIPAYPLYNKPYNNLTIPYHNQLLVNINHKLFLIDVGIGHYGTRYPVEFSFEKTEEQEIFPGEKHQLICANDHYLFRTQIKGEWISLFRIDRPLRFVDIKQTMLNQQKQGCIEKNNPRASCKAMLLTEHGYIIFYIKPKQSILSAYRVCVHNGKENKKSYNTYKEFADDIFKNIGLYVPKNLI